MASSFPIKTALIRQVSASAAIQFSTNNSTWTNISTWPFTIGNNLPENNILKVKFTTNITLPNIKSDYFILTSPNIIIDGNNKSITVNNFVNFPGLITNGSATENGNNNITVKNISFGTTGSTTLLSGQGWICKNYFGKGSTGNVIQNCSSSGPISTNSGGVAGQYTAINSTGFIISGCSATGSILDGAAGANAGGIVGANSGSLSSSFTITTCAYSGNINGNGSGGIIGARSNNFSITFCSSSGIIKGGGIAGDYTGISGLVTISNCFSKGNIGSSVGTSGATSAGGIIGAYGGLVNITRCYSIGEIGGEGRNDCGGIVGGDSAVNVSRCFTIGNIYNRCGGIVGKNFAKNSTRRCDIQDCYTLGDIYDSAGGIAGPEYAQSSLETCYIQYCFSLGKLITNFSGGIIAPTTGIYPSSGPAKKSFVISSCHNNFTNSNNGIVGLGYNLGTGPIDPAKSTVIEKYGNENYITNVSYTIVRGSINIGTTIVSRVSQAEAQTANTNWYESYTAIKRTQVPRLTRGYYNISLDILQQISFDKIEKLGLTISEYLGGGLGINSLLNNGVDFSPINGVNLKTSVFDPLGISLNDLFTGNYGLDIINKIGYNANDILSSFPDTTYKSLIDANFNFKKNTSAPNTIAHLIHSSVQPTLTVSDIIKAGFFVSEIKALDPPMTGNGPFSLTRMRDEGVSASYLLGAGGYGWWNLKGHGFNAEHFRVSGFNTSFLVGTAGFKPLEFQGSRFPMSSFSSIRYSNIVTSFTDDQLIQIGFDKNRVIAENVFKGFYGEEPIATYIRFNYPISEIPKYTNITNIKQYTSNPYTPMGFINSGWSPYSVARMGWSARQLLDSGRFNLSDLKTVGYPDTEILASGHSSATVSKLATASVLTKNNPPVITELVTDEGKIYVYFKNAYSNASPIETGIGYSLDGGETYTVTSSIRSPLIISDVDFSVDYTLYITTINGDVSDPNYISVATMKKPILKKTKPNGWKIAIGVVIAVAAVAAFGFGGPFAGQGAFMDITIGAVNLIVEASTVNMYWTEGKASHLHKLIYPIVKQISPSPEKTSKLYGSNYNITNNTVFLFSVPTITNIIGENKVCTVYFTNSIKFGETIDDIYYTSDDGRTWQPCAATPQTTSPVIINNGNFSLSGSVSIAIRNYKRDYVTNVDIANPKNTVVACRDGLNYMYSSKTNSTYTNTVKLGLFGGISNTFDVNMLYGPLAPSIYHISYDPKTTDVNFKDKARIYLDQQLNCGGYITDYQWTTDGKTWTSAGLNLTKPLADLNKTEMGLAANQQLYNPIKSFTINVTSKPSYKISIRAININGLLSQGSPYYDSRAISINDWLRNNSWAYKTNTV